MPPTWRGRCLPSTAARATAWTSSGSKVSIGLAPPSGRFSVLLTGFSRIDEAGMASTREASELVAAASAAHAEVHATAVLVDPREERVQALDDLGVGVLVVDRRGSAHGNTAWRRMRRLTAGIAGAS